MIIKSLGRKAGKKLMAGAACASSLVSPIASLAGYMNRGITEWHGKAVLWHNLFGSAKSTEQEIIAAFESNASLLSERKNGNVLYHEIISFSSGHGLAAEELTQAIADIGQEYLRQRASDQLAYGVVHLDTEHIHLHLMISANQVDHSDRVRLPKKQFAQVQKDVEQFVLERYPELAQTRIYDQEQTQDKTKLRAHEQAMKVRTQKPSRKEDVKERLQQLFAESSSEADLIQRAKAEGITFYQRGKSLSVNVLDAEGRERKHRLSTLGLQGQYYVTLQHFAQQQAKNQRQTPEPTIEQTPQDSRENDLRLVLAKRQQIELESERKIEQTKKTSSSIWLPDGDILFHHLNMNAKQAKEISLPGFLAQLGFEPAHTRWADIWYTSPFRPDEHTPSFKIDHGRNFWYDFGMGKGGTIIELVQHLYATEDVARALTIISEVSSGVPHAMKQSILPANRPAKEKPIIESVGQITDKLLEAYLQGRAIPLDLARLYLQQMQYRIGGKAYRALSFANESQGYEVRNPWFKGTMGSKDISFLAQPERQDIAVFEGVFDFLSMLTYHGQERANANVLVLNSVALVEPAILRMKEEGIQKLYGYLDRDSAGKQALETLRAANTWQVKDGSSLYQEHKDLNEFLQHHQRQKHRQQGRGQIELER